MLLAAKAVEPLKRLDQAADSTTEDADAALGAQDDADAAPVKARPRQSVFAIFTGALSKKKDKVRTHHDL